MRIGGSDDRESFSEGEGIASLLLKPAWGQGRDGGISWIEGKGESMHALETKTKMKMDMSGNDGYTFR